MLLVFVLASVIAVSLYFELPRVMFERTREREQLLIDRGEQYSLAVRRFYVKFGRWPAKMDDLENTNNIRFLRRQYKDPMTGDTDWRIIHETAGVLTDSLVKPANQPAQGQNGSTGGAGQTFGTLTSSQPTGSSMTASSDESSDQPVPEAWGIASRPSDRGPLGTAHGGASTGDDTALAENGGGPGAMPPDMGSPSANPPAGQDSNMAANQGAGSGVGGATGATGPAGVNDAILAIQHSLTSPRQFPGTSSGQQSSAVTGGGLGIAGVASKSNLKGIKLYHDHQKYKEWEFVFDMSTLQQLQNPQAVQQQQQVGQQPLQGQPGGIGSTTGTGQTNTTAPGNTAPGNGP